MTGIVAAPRFGTRARVAVLGAEIRKGLAVQWGRPVANVFGVLASGATFLAMQYVRGQGRLQHNLLAQTLLAMSVFMFLFFVTLVMVGDLIEEKNTGTHAQSHLTPAPPWLLMVGRLATASIDGVLMGVVAVGVPMLVVQVSMPVAWVALVPYALALANALAFAFLLAAIAVATPVIAQLQDLIIKLVFLLGGSLLPVTLYPGWLAALARIMPTTLGVEATTRVLWFGRPLKYLWDNGSLPILIGYTVALSAVAWVLYIRNYRKARRDGRLGQY